MENWVIYTIIGILVVGFGALFYLVIDMKRKSEEPKDDSAMKVMMEWMKEIKTGTDATREGMQKSINETNQAINERLDNAGRVIAGLQKELGSMSQIGPDLRRLSETLASPKLRGNFGEEMLENMLSQVLPTESYSIQYRFKNGETVDAIVKIGKQILPIDSKFSMENFRLMKEAKSDDAIDTLKKTFLRDVKKRVEEISKKYVLPQENTFDFALMYVPSEGVYQELLEDIDVVEYSRKKHVIPVGPNSLFIYLKNIIVSLRGQEINQKAHELLKMISGIRQESDKFGRQLEILTNHIKNAGNSVSGVNSEFLKLRGSIENAAALQLDKDKKESLPESILEK